MTIPSVKTGEEGAGDGGIKSQRETALNIGERFASIEKKHKVYALLFILYVLITTSVVVATGQRAFLLVVIVAGPIIFYIPFRYFYVRVFSPFTRERRQVSDENDVRSSACNCSCSEIVAPVIFFTLVFVMFLPLFLVESVHVEKDEPLLFVVLGYNALGSMIILAVVILLVDFAEILVGLVKYLSQKPRREFASTVLLQNRSPKPKAILIIVLYVICLTGALVYSYKEPQVITTEIRLSKFPDCLSGYRIVLITDLHSGPLVGRSSVERLVELVNTLNADIVLLGGDMADGIPDQIGIIVQPFENLISKDGVYYAVGNHEYLHGGSGPAWLAFVSQYGVIPLNNSRVSLPANSTCGTFDLIGLDDFMGNPSIENATLNRNVSHASVLLAHQPNFSRETGGHNIDLQLSGHTHAGQIWPLHVFTLLANTYFAGLYHASDGSQVYVSQGAVGWGPRTRVLSANNIEVITLVPGIPRTDPPVHYSVIWAYIGFPFLIIMVILCCFCAGPARRLVDKEERMTV